jgi:hypothetical protein
MRGIFEKMYNEKKDFGHKFFIDNLKFTSLNYNKLCLIYVITHNIASVII